MLKSKWKIIITNHANSRDFGLRVRKLHSQKANFNCEIQMLPPEVFSSDTILKSWHSFLVCSKASSRGAYGHDPF